MSYTPQVDDYVRWTDSLGRITEGWVYFVDSAYITIEVGVKCKTDENIKDCPLHQKIHTLICCFPENWEELEYVTNRRDEEKTSYDKIPSRY